jgi:FlaA1/EpsC-like NDP-sugar epimerase
MEKNKKLIIFGTAAIAEVVYWYFKEDSVYEPIAFCANKDRIEQETLLGLPVVPFEEIENNYCRFYNIDYPSLIWAQLYLSVHSYVNRQLERQN